MNELYWITRFDAINTIALILFVLAIVASVIFLICLYAANGQKIYDESRDYTSSAKEMEGYVKTCKKSLSISVPCLVILALVLVFTPTTKQAFVIYGVGGTVDYLKSNPTAKQLPDKCFKALDKWVDSWNTEGKKDSIK